MEGETIGEQRKGGGAGDGGGGAGGGGERSVLNVMQGRSLGWVVDRRWNGLLLVAVVVASPLAAVLLLVVAHQPSGEHGLHLPTRA